MCEPLVRCACALTHAACRCFNQSTHDTPVAPTLDIFFRDLVSPTDGKLLQRSLSLAALQAIATALPDDTHYLPRPSDAVLNRIDALLTHEAESDAKALRPALFLAVALLRTSWLESRSHGLSIDVTATDRFPIGAGLGSSAAFSVALASALLLSTRAFRALDDAALAQVNAYAFAAEVILHGAPSGVDNTVATYGGALVFTKLPAPAFTRIASDLNRFRFLLVNTRVPRSTKQQVANVRALYDADCAAVTACFDAIDAIAKDFVERSERHALSEQQLAHMIALNHAQLNALGVGHDAIERVAGIAHASGATTKLTGAGGGGCTLSLLPSELDDAALQQLVRALEASGFECFVSAVGGAGVQVEEA